MLDRDRGSFEEAFRKLQDAQIMRQQLLDAGDNPRIQRDLAQGFYNWANLCFQQADFANGEKQMQEAAELFEDLLVKDPKDLHNHYRLAACWRSLGDFAMARRERLRSDAPPDADQLEELQQAEARYQQARLELELLARQNRAVMAYQSELAVIYMNLGRVTFESHDLPASARWLRQALPLLREVCQKDPENAASKQNLQLAARALEQIEQQLEQSPSRNLDNTETSQD